MWRSMAGGGAYFGAVFLIGFVLGVVRLLVLVPLAGETLAVVVELPIILGFAWFACRWLIRAMGVPGSFPDRLVMGAVAFALLMLGEVAISVFLGGRDLAGHFALYRQAPHLLGLAGQIAFALFPALHLHLHLHRPGPASR